MEDGRFFRYERPFGEFTRSVALPEGTGDGEAGAHYANGVLEVHVQKPEQSSPAGSGHDDRRGRFQRLAPTYFPERWPLAASPRKVSAQKGAPREAADLLGSH
jgi:Hsp20/alpha crystallin family